MNKIKYIFLISVICCIKLFAIPPCYISTYEWQLKDDFNYNGDTNLHWWSHCYHNEFWEITGKHWPFINDRYISLCTKNAPDNIDIIYYWKEKEMTDGEYYQETRWSCKNGRTSTVDYPSFSKLFPIPVDEYCEIVNVPVNFAYPNVYSRSSHCYKGIWIMDHSHHHFTAICHVSAYTLSDTWPEQTSTLVSDHTKVKVNGVEVDSNFNINITDIIGDGTIKKLIITVDDSHFYYFHISAIAWYLTDG